MLSRDQSRHQPCPSHTPCKMCCRSTTQSLPCNSSMVSMAHHPGPPGQVRTHHSCVIPRQSSGPEHKPMHHCRMVSLGPDRCRGTQMDRSSTQLMHWERSTLRCSPHTLYSHSHHRHTHQPHKDCIPSLRRLHSAQHCTSCTLSTHRCPNQQSQLRKMCSWSTQQQSIDQTHTLHKA